MKEIDLSHGYLINYRNQIIEECARMVISWTMTRGYNMDVAEELANAIRAMKDK